MDRMTRGYPHFRKLTEFETISLVPTFDKAGMPADARPSMFKSRPSTAIWQGPGEAAEEYHGDLGNSIEIPIEIPIEIHIVHIQKYSI